MVGDELTVGTWNLWERGMATSRGRRGVEVERCARQERVMRELLPCHIWAVQEVGSEAALAALAEALGLEYLVWPIEGVATPAYDRGGRGFGVGVLWDPSAGISAVPGAVRTYTHDVLYHGLASVVLDLGADRLLHVAAGHATPWGAPQSVVEAKRWVSALTRPHRGLPQYAGWVPPGVLGTDSNNVTGDLVLRAGAWVYHAPDPLDGAKWVPDMVYRAAHPYDRDGAGIPVPRSDRAPGDILHAGGLHDATAVLGRVAVATTGYASVDPFPPTDLDHLRVTADLRNALLDVTVLDHDDVRTSSDHRPKRITLDRSRIPSTPGSR